MSREYDVAYPYGVGGETLLDRIAVDFDSWLTSAVIGYAFNRCSAQSGSELKRLIPNLRQVCGRAVWNPFPDRPLGPGTTKDSSNFNLYLNIF